MLSDGNLNLGLLLMLGALLLGLGWLIATGRVAGLTQPATVNALALELATLKADNADLRADNKGLHFSVQVLARQGGELGTRLTVLEAELAQVRQERDLLARRNALLEATFEARGTAPPNAALDGSRLHIALTTLFSVSELQQLCSDLKVDYESIEGDDKGSKARELTAFFERRGDLPVLAAAVKKLRPNARL
jgi:hypothetical protein